MSDGRPAPVELAAVPHDGPAEGALLASMIVDPACIPQVLDVVRADSFFDPRHTALFGAVQALWAAGTENLDGLLVREALERRGELDAAGGVEYLQALLEAVPSAANAPYYAQIVRDRALSRGLLAAGSRITALAQAGRDAGPIEERLDAAQAILEAVTAADRGARIAPLARLLQPALEGLAAAMDGRRPGLPCPFPSLERLSGGFRPGELIVVAGRPGMGKSALSLVLALHAAQRQARAILYCSLEMSRDQMVERILCLLSDVPVHLVRGALLSAAQYSALLAAAARAEPLPLYLDDAGSPAVVALRSQARRLRTRTGLALVVVDYLQLLAAADRRAPREQQVSGMARDLKALARDLEVPLVAVSQLNRAAEAREDHRPRLSDLRESGAIEQEADAVLFVHREDYYHRHEPAYVPTHRAELIVAKQRNGPTGVISLCFAPGPIGFYEPP